MTWTLADAADMTDVSIQEMGIKSIEQADRSWSEIYSVETGVVDLYTKDSSISGLGYAGRIVENAAAPEAVPVQGFDQTYTQAQYGVLFTLSKMQWMFGVKKRKLEQITQEAVKAVAALRSRRLYEKLSNGWSTSYTAQDITGNYTITLTGGDGAALFSDSHTREDAGTNNNNIITDGTTVNMDFDYDALKAMHRTAGLIRDPRGLPMNVSIDTVIVSKNTTNYFLAQEILGAVKGNKLPRSADNDASGIPSFKVHASPWLQLTNSDYWFGMDTSMKDGIYGSLQYKEAQDIQMSPVNVVYKTGELQWKVDAVFAWGHNDYRNIVGSDNTNA